MNVILYSTGCPKCNVLKTKLANKKIKYIENNNVDDMLSLGIEEVPVLSIDERLLTFTEANQWINESEAQ